MRNLRRVARELGETMSEDEIRAMVDEFDTDGDGESKKTILILQYLLIAFIEPCIIVYTAHVMCL